MSRNLWPNHSVVETVTKTRFSIKYSSRDWKCSYGKAWENICLRKKTDCLYNFAFHATSLQKLHRVHQWIPSIKSTRNQNWNRLPTLQTRGSAVNLIMSSDTGARSIGQQAGAEPNELTTGTASTVHSPSSSLLLPHGSSTRALTYRFNLCRMCFEKRHRTRTTRLSPTNKKLPMHMKGISLRGLQPWKP